MRCDDVRILISAEIDGELAGPDEDRVAEHLSTCAGCTEWAARARQLRRTTLIRPLGEEVDLTAAVLARASVPRVGWRSGLRVLLAYLGVVLLLLNAPLLVTGDEADASEHVGRHLGAFGLAIAIGFLYAAWRPERAIGLVPVAAALAIGLTVSATFDLANGGGLGDEVLHLLEITGLVCLWVISGGPGRAGRRLRSLRRTHRPLTAVS